MSGGEGLSAEPIQKGGDTDFDKAGFAAESSARAFICSSILVATHSAAVSLPALRWINAAIGAMNALVESSFF